VVVTGIDNFPLWKVSSLNMKEVFGQEEVSLDLPTETPMRNTYIRQVDSLPSAPYTLVYRAVDREGKEFIDWFFI